MQRKLIFTILLFILNKISSAQHEKETWVGLSSFPIEISNDKDMDYFFRLQKGGMNIFADYMIISDELYHPFRNELYHLYLSNNAMQ